jgi:uncharacterized protein YjbI with pentapeptide repeats
MLVLNDYRPMTVAELLSQYARGERRFGAIELPEGSSLAAQCLAGAEFDSAWLDSVDFTAADLRGTSFRNAHLKLCSFENADLSGADLRGAAIDAASFANACLDGTQLENAAAYGHTFTAHDRPL